MSYTILTTYFFNLNNFEKIIKRQSLRKNLLHKVHNFVLNYKFRDLNENYFDNKILQDKILCIYHNFAREVFFATDNQYLKTYKNCLLKYGICSIYY